MNIVFIASPSNNQSVKDNYEHIIKACEKLGNYVSEDYLKNSSKNIKTYRSILSQIKKSDVVVVEGTKITGDISRFISVALQFRIPTLILYRKTNPEAFVFESNRLLSIKKYSPKSMEPLLSRFFNQANKDRLLYRFNIMLSKDMNSYIMDRSRKSQVSKADYIRNLILKDMDKIKKTK